MRSQRSILSINLIALIFVTALTPLLANASTITFEPVAGLLPDGSVATDNMSIVNQYLVSHGVSFGIDNDLDGLPDAAASPKLEAIGNDANNGFSNDTLGLIDTAAIGLEAQLGSWFLRTDAGISNLLITYSTPTDAASGELWDIDGGLVSQQEQWLVEPLDLNLLPAFTNVLSPLGAGLTYDGKPWTFAISHGSADIYAIRLRYVGNTTGPRGVAFNNFSPTTVPEPSTLTLVLVGLAFLGGSRPRRREQLRRR